MESARTFTVRLADLLAREHTSLAELLVALADFDRRRLWLDLGYGSLFDFLHRELGLSKASASFRKKAAELLQRFPELVEPIRDGRLCLTSVFELAKVLTPENRDEVLPRFFHLSRREAKGVAAALRPEEAPPRREVVAAVRVADASPAGRVELSRSSAPAAALADAPPSRDACAPIAPGSAGHGGLDFTQGGLTGQTGACQLEATAPEGTPSRVASAPPPPETSAEPLTADLSRLHVTVSRRFLEKLERARAALSHSHPGASADEILEAGLDLLLERHARRRGLVKKPRRVAPPCGAEQVPAHVRREVWERDGGRCQWPLASGGTCGSTHRVEVDHRTPRARGGEATAENLRLLCRRHNDRAAREAFGDDWMDRFTRGGAAPRGSRLDAGSA